ncbi:MAG TPA: nitrate reductase molybdenum cofactor assembly chaperone [Marmoricola sp.]|jgi:nitrate reductase delta subunit|nr:nitrate reductase molybdenum cofactor assembly chaperone [Marmoricola sp.]
MSRRSAPTLPAEQLSTVWQSASLLLGYPDERLLAELPVVRRAVAALPDTLAAPLVRVADDLERTPLPDLQVAYVDTFDNRRRCNLYLTYFTHGDTRKRGLALLRFKQTYLRSGFVLDASPAEGEELPDHLCVVLEYAATVDRRLGWKLLLDHRASVEVLRLSLRDAGSLWAGAVEAVCATLPRVRADEQDLVRKLVEEGPPAEEVGLTPYGEPAFDPMVGGVR